MKITHEFDSGSIEVVAASERRNIVLKLSRDNKSDHRQWFHFKLATTKGKPHKIRIINAGNSSFAKAWQGYQVVASYDQENWFRVATEFERNELIIRHTPEYSTISYAYFTPYSYERHKKLIAGAKSSPLCNHTSLGITNDNNPVDLLTLGNAGKNKHAVWLIARQHPGETMAQWFIEGMLKRLLSNDPYAEQLLETSVFYIVPNMNPDGSIRGNHRTNSNGFDLNRQWADPSATDCPEVFYVRQAMHDKGVSLFLDIHGDEELPYNFIIGGNSSCRFKKQTDLFKRNFAAANADFQHAVDYSTYSNGRSDCCGSRCGKPELSKAGYYVGQTFGCLSLTLEMPFIDNINQPDIDTGWSAQRSMALGANVLEPLLASLQANSANTIN